MFYDVTAGGFFSTAEGQADLILRLKDGMDNAEPSTNGIASSNLCRLGSILAEEEYGNLARGTLQAFEAEVMQHPFLFTSLLDSIVSARLGVRSLIITGEGDEVDRAVAAVRTTIDSFRTCIRVGGAKSSWLRARNPILGAMDVARASVQVCERGACRLVGEEEITIR
jgi:uncharacterized protein YyaL (SSP411 family)